MMKFNLFNKQFRIQDDQLHHEINNQENVDVSTVGEVTGVEDSLNLSTNDCNEFYWTTKLIKLMLDCYKNAYELFKKNEIRSKQKVYDIV